MEVSLFDRKKNRITLNENGRLLEEYAARLLQQEREMIRNASGDATRRPENGYALGSCAPVPVGQDLVPLLTRLFERDDHRFRNPQQ